MAGCASTRSGEDHIIDIEGVVSNVDSRGDGAEEEEVAKALNSAIHDGSGL